MNRPVQPVLARLDPDFVSWLASNACALDRGEEDAGAVLPRLADAGVTAAGVPFHHGGVGGDIVDGIAAVSAVAEESLADQDFIAALAQGDGDPLDHAADPCGSAACERCPRKAAMTRSTIASGGESSLSTVMSASA